MFLWVNKSTTLMGFPAEAFLLSESQVTQTCQPLVRADDTKNPDLSGAGYDKFGIKKRGGTP